MKILLAYVFLQAVLPSYLASTLAPNDQHRLATLHRRENAVQAIPGHDGQVSRLRRRSPGMSSSGYSTDDNTFTDNSSGDDNPSNGAMRPQLRRRSNLRRRGDYSMLQRRSPLNRLQRRSPFLNGFFGNDNDKKNGNGNDSSSDDNGYGNQPLNGQGPNNGYQPTVTSTNPSSYGDYTPSYLGGQS
ncbi:hypothetical protein IWQ62_003073 [Dispira parvispora]|uniref:Uncharacterized protein n=1 Tax=Dispira parvispora TaxID=1520584 RepID=A0A9W8AVI2_9FUNG|nr:hypothetical protein IWQ62_003073 [Dispira parvispora]